MAYDKPFDDLTCSEITVRLMHVLVSYNADDKALEMREALVSVLTAVVSAPVLHGTEEDVFKVSLKLRGEIYSAVMQRRRALLSDIERRSSDA